MRIPREQQKQMREQTLGYVLAVFCAHPELAPFDPEPEIDPYPLHDCIPNPPLLPLTGIRQIAHQVGMEVGLTLKELRGRSREKFVVRARWECFARCRAEGYSLPSIGNFFRRDHTTVLHGLRQMGCAPKERAA